MTQTNASADTAAIRLRSDGANLDPVVIELRVAAQKLRIIVDGVDHDVDVAVVVEIAESRATRAGSGSEMPGPAWNEISAK